MHALYIETRGNVGNRMFQYAFASLLKLAIGDCEIIGAHLPEWGVHAKQLPDRPFSLVVQLDDWTNIDLETLLTYTRYHNPVLFVLRGYFQNISLLPERAFASTVLFPRNSPQEDNGGLDNRLLINIRAGDILSGNAPFYPLIPAAFYESLVQQTGLSPIFVGQVNDGGPYLDQLRKTFPDAQFIGTGSPMDDFALVRSGKHICLAVSTFSWMAAWLSDASEIFYPVLGLFHPKLGSCYGIQPTNLPPTNDPRYRFFLFPVAYALPGQAAIAYHGRVLNCWREISSKQMAFIRDRAPFTPVHRTQTFVDSLWYCHTFVLAAMEIAEGWYQDPAHHYADVGRLRGYLPHPRAC